MIDPIKIKKSKVEFYLVGWDSHEKWLYVAIKVIRIFHKKGGVTQEKFKNMINTASIDQTLPAPLQEKQRREALRQWKEVNKAVVATLKEMPKKKVEF